MTKFIAYVEEPEGHLFIFKNAENNPVEVYLPFLESGEIEKQSKIYNLIQLVNGQNKLVHKYKTYRKKAKQVNFSDF